MNEYLNAVLESQKITQNEIKNLNYLAQTIKKQISILEGHPQFFIGGSFGKQTMIRSRYDLDLLVYWPSSAKQYSIKDLYIAVGDILQQYYRPVNSKNVCWEIPFNGGFHIDVVPGRALDSNFNEANLHRNDTGTTLKTSLKAQVDFVANCGRVPIIKLLKLWRVKKQVPFKKSFLLEIMAINGCEGKGYNDYQDQFFTALRYIRDNILTCKIQDPANSNNFLTDDLTPEARIKIRDAAELAISARLWDHIFK
ncbi:nucleotidyltransferase [Estrella lausannensis]|uniref:Cyclic GMP-AMP synthase n=1 Tax=Estrella lausannensis TaxID=483423 RepID=A0A0H5DQ71_9BACT|nr:nucleotidyltransferase [Estrella lausannensis]CRX38203.1 hypothetical protein ELAC_0854 [Estrella lausannensis]